MSGFGVTDGHPLDYRDRIPRISNPSYVAVSDSLYEQQTLCVGIKTINGWRFSPLSVLNSREIVVHKQDNTALSHCPLAGLTIAMEGDISISGLLKYDTFVLYDNVSEDMILPFTQTMYSSDGFVPLKEVQLLNFFGVRKNFPNARILDPQSYAQRNPYGPYPDSDLQGIGHDKPGLRYQYDGDKIGFHPKEWVLICGFEGKLQKAYPFKELEASVPGTGGTIRDTIEGQTVTVTFHPQSRWAYATDTDGHSINLAYAYIFSMYQHLPKIAIYRNPNAPRRK